MGASERKYDPVSMWRRFQDKLANRPKAKKVLYWAPFLAMGPISGPLAEGVVRNLRKGNKVLAGLYAFAVVETFFVLPIALAAATLNLTQVQEAMAEQRAKAPPANVCPHAKAGPDLPGKLDALAG